MVKTVPYRVFVMCYGHKKQPVGRGALTPPPGRHPPCGSPVGVGVPDDPCPLPAGKNRLGNDTHPTNSISVYSVLPFKNASAGMVT